MIMRNLATCYSEHAIKISDSYCTGPSSNHSYISPNLIPPIQESVTCIYKTAKLLNKKQFLVKLTWCDLITKSFTIFLSDHSLPPFHFSLKNAHKFQTVQGSKKLELFGSKIEILWDLFNAKYDHDGPEPSKGFYLSVLIDSEVCLKLGDSEKEAKPELKFSLISRSEHFSGEGLFSSQVKFSDTGEIHQITIKCFGDDKGARNSTLSVSIDGKTVVSVKRLQWNFRGNQTIFIEGLLVDMMWDIKDWFFKLNSGNGIFMFRTRSGLDSRLWLEEQSLKERDGFSFMICACKIPD